MSKTIFRTALIAAVVSFVGLASGARAAECGNTGAGFENWKAQFVEEAKQHGVSAAGVAALMGTNYSPATISADRGQHSFHLSLDQFLAKRGGPTIISQGRALSTLR